MAMSCPEDRVLQQIPAPVVLQTQTWSECSSRHRGSGPMLAILQSLVGSEKSNLTSWFRFVPAALV